MVKAVAAGVLWVVRLTEERKRNLGGRLLLKLKLLLRRLLLRLLLLLRMRPLAHDVHRTPADAEHCAQVLGHELPSVFGALQPGCLHLRVHVRRAGQG